MKILFAVVLILAVYTATTEAQGADGDPCQVAGVNIIGTVCKSQCKIVQTIGNCESGLVCCWGSRSNE